MLRSLPGLILFAALSGAGCRHHDLVAPSEAVPQVPLARAFTLYNGQLEQPPSDLAPDLLVDDALLTVTPAEFCFDLVVRAPRPVDRPLEMQEFECLLNGPNTAALVRQAAAPTTTEHRFVGNPPALMFSGPGGVLNVPLGPGEERFFHIVERRGRVCCPAAPTESLELEMAAGSASGMDPGGYSRLEWQWRLVRGRYVPAP